MPEKERTPFIPAALDDAGLDPREFRVFCRVSRRGRCIESKGKMASGTGVGVNSVREALGILVCAGMLLRTPRPGKTPAYEELPPSSWTDIQAARAAYAEGKRQRQESAPPPGRPPETPDEPATESWPLHGYVVGAATEPWWVPATKAWRAYKGTPFEGTPTKVSLFKKQHHQTEEGRAPAPARDTPGDDDADSENDFGLWGRSLEVARKLYSAGVDGQGGRIAQQLTAQHGAGLVEKQLRNLALRQGSGFVPRNGPGAWLVTAIRDDHDLPSEKRGGHPSRQKHQPSAHCGDGQAGPAPQQPRHPARSQQPPEHQGGAPSRPEPPPPPISDDVQALLGDVLQKGGGERSAEQRGQRSMRRQAIKLQRFRGNLAASLFELEPLEGGLPLTPPIFPPDLPVSL